MFAQVGPIIIIYIWIDPAHGGRCSTAFNSFGGGFIFRSGAAVGVTMVIFKAHFLAVGLNVGTVGDQVGGGVITGVNVQIIKNHLCSGGDTVKYNYVLFHVLFYFVPISRRLIFCYYL